MYYERHLQCKPKNIKLNYITNCITMSKILYIVFKSCIVESFNYVMHLFIYYKNLLVFHTISVLYYTILFILNALKFKILIQVHY